MTFFFFWARGDSILKRVMIIFVSGRVSMCSILMFECSVMLICFRRTCDPTLDDNVIE